MDFLTLEMTKPLNTFERLCRPDAKQKGEHSTNIICFFNESEAPVYFLNLKNKHYRGSSRCSHK